MTSLRAAASGRRDEDQENRVRHVVIREAEIIKQPSTHVVYKVNVLTQWNHWSVLRRYSEFFHLHIELVQRYGIARDLLPPKRFTGNLSAKVIESRREALEHYLQRLVNSHFEIATSKILATFLDVQSHDVIQVAKRLSRRAFEEGDAILSNRRPFHYTPTEMFCICKRLKLPISDGDSTDGASTDLSHLYSFINQLESLNISVPAGHPSSCNMPFSLAHFRSLRSLTVDSCPVALMEGFATIQAQLRHLAMHHILNSIRAVIEDAAVERRGASSSSASLVPSSMDSWRRNSVVSLTTERPVVQPWKHLTHLNFSRNRIVALDDSLRLLPALQEANFSHNMFQSVDLNRLCLTQVKKANFSHNQIASLTPCIRELRPMLELSLSHNRLRSVNGLDSFSQLRSLHLDHNLLASHTDLSALSDMAQLRTLQVAANPYSQKRGYRIGTLSMLPHAMLTVAVDGSVMTPAETARFEKLSQKHGSDSLKWPENALKRTSSFSSGGAPTPVTSGPSTLGVVAPEALRSDARQSPLTPRNRRAEDRPRFVMGSPSPLLPREGLSGPSSPVSSGATSSSSPALTDSDQHLSDQHQSSDPAASSHCAPFESSLVVIPHSEIPLRKGEHRVLRLDSPEAASDFERNPFNDQALLEARNHYLASRSWSPPQAMEVAQARGSSATPAMSSERHGPDVISEEPSQDTSGNVSDRELTAELSQDTSGDTLVRGGRVAVASPNPLSDSRAESSPVLAATELRDTLQSPNESSDLLPSQMSNPGGEETRTPDSVASTDEEAVSNSTASQSVQVLSCPERELPSEAERLRVDAVAITLAEASVEDGLHDSGDADVIATEHCTPDTECLSGDATAGSDDVTKASNDVAKASSDVTKASDDVVNPDSNTGGGQPRGEGTVSSRVTMSGDSR